MTIDITDKIQKLVDFGMTTDDIEAATTTTLHEGTDKTGAVTYSVDEMVQKGRVLSLIASTVNAASVAAAKTSPVTQAPRRTSRRRPAVAASNDELYPVRHRAGYTMYDTKTQIWDD